MNITGCIIALCSMVLGVILTIIRILNENSNQF